MGSNGNSDGVMHGIFFKSGYTDLEHIFNSVSPELNIFASTCSCCSIHESSPYKIHRIHSIRFRSPGMLQEDPEIALGSPKRVDCIDM